MMTSERWEDSTTAAPSQNICPANPSETERVLAQLDALPTLPAVATRLLELTGDARTGARDLSRVIESDPSLAARLLALARRADRGIGVSTIHQVVVLLGFDTVRNLALSAKVFELFTRDVACPWRVFDASAFWKHSLAVGCAAQVLVERGLGAEVPGGAEMNAEIAFLCGLLHDIGKIALASCFPKAYDRAMDKAEDCLLNLGDVERSIFGLDHTIVGRRLADHWKLPEIIGQVVWLHHHAPAALPRLGHPHYLCIVQWADEIVHRLRIGYAGRQDVRRDAPQALRAVFEPGPEHDQFRDAIIEAVRQRAELIGLDRLTSREVYQEALSRASDELVRTNERLAELNLALAERAQGFEALRILKKSLPDEPAHEDVCRAALAALGRLLPDQPVGLAVYSAVRQVVWVAANRGDETPAVQSWPVGKARLVEHAAVPGQWMPAQMISRVWADRVSELLGQTLTDGRAIGSGRGLCGLVCLTEPVSGQRETVDVLCDWIETWLADVENRLASNRLSEELSQINRRLVDTQVEAARMRSLAMVGRMAAGAAHEINNPLTVVSGRAQLLAASGTDLPSQQIGKVIFEHAQRASGIVSELMSFAKPPVPTPTVWSAAVLLSRLRDEWIAKGAFSEREFQFHLSDELPEIRADEAQIHMLFDELIRNAVEAMRGRSDRLLMVNCWKDVADEKVMIRLEDNGCGMSADVVEHAVDPFFSHRAAGRGRGLGLSRAARCAEINGGSIRLSSTPGEGTKVLVALPSAEPTP